MWLSILEDPLFNSHEKYLDNLNLSFIFAVNIVHNLVMYFNDIENW